MSYALPFLSFSEVSNIKICLLKLRSQQHYECTVILSNADMAAFFSAMLMFYYLYMAYGPVNYYAQIRRKEIASVHFNDLFSGCFISNDSNKIFQ